MEGISSVVETLGKQRFKVSRLVELGRIPSEHHSLSYQLLDSLVEACDLAREISEMESEELEVTKW